MPIAIPVSNAVLLKIQRFHLANPEELLGLEEWALWLESLLHGPCSVVEHGRQFVLSEEKQLVKRLSGLEIQIYSDEHPPPHFHVKSPDVAATFAIEDCRLINGDIDGKSERKIKYWHTHSKPLLVSIWNSTRPAGCVVGKIQPPKKQNT
jgi:hypothetical protein